MFIWIELESSTIEGDSPVNEKAQARNEYTPKYHGAREILWESAQTIG